MVMSNNKIYFELNYSPSGSGKSIEQGIFFVKLNECINSYHEFEIKLNADIIETNDTLFHKSKDNIGKVIKINLGDHVFVGIVTKISIVKTNNSFKGDLVIS